MMNVYLKLILILLNVLISHVVYSACLPDPTFRTLYLNIDMGRIVVKPSDVVGKILATREVPFTALVPIINSTYNCKPGVLLTTFQAELVNNPSLSLLSNNIYNTNIPGIGIRIKHNTTTIGSVFTDYYPYSKPYRTTSTGSWTLGTGTLGIEIIKTAQSTGAGALQARNYSLFTIDQNQNQNLPWIYSAMNNNGTTIASSSCQIVGGANRTVKLQTISKSSLTGVGTTAGDTAFNLNIQCNGAVSTTTQTSNSANMTIDFTADASNLNIMKNNAVTSAAQGVGVQLVWINQSNEQVMGKGSKIDLGSIQSNQQQLINLAFRARYYQTQTTVQSGEVQAQATVTFDYL